MPKASRKAKMNRIAVIFSSELAKISDQGFRKAVVEIINDCPDYIAEFPSSTTGKYHPVDEVDENGMIYHIKRCLVFAEETARMREHPKYEADILLAGCILYDIFKGGYTAGDHTDPMHPVYIYKKIMSYIEKSEDNHANMMLEKLAFVCLLHEGQWTIKQSLDVRHRKMRQDEIKLCESMHMVDFYASRRSVYEVMQNMTHEVVDG